MSHEANGKLRGQPEALSLEERYFPKRSQFQNRGRYCLPRIVLRKENSKYRTFQAPRFRMNRAGEKGPPETNPISEFEGNLVLL